MVSLSTSACILGPEVSEEPQEPLYPPRILLEHLDPPAGGLTNFRIVDCDALTFVVSQVEDGNTGDVLYGRWFIDYDPEHPEEYDATLYREFVLNTNGKEIRDSAEYPRLSFTLALNLFASVDEGDTHAVMVAIGDRPFSNEKGIGFSDTDERSRDGQYDIWQWAIRMSNTGYCDEGQ
jgi:hypothetical protein